MENSTTEPFNTANSNAMLCDGFLIPMTDFVLEQLNEQNSRTKPMREVFNSLEKYAKFLKQPLKLEMFVPCDDEGIVLEEPKIEEEYVDEHTTQIFAQYQYDLDKAKENVLFDGFELKEIGSICAPNKLVIGEFDEFEKSVKFYYSMEKLAEYKVFQLSQTALNTIFGKTVA